MTDAHEQQVTIRFIERWPMHEPRAKDPHYKLFNAAKRRLKKAGLLKCVVESNYHYGQIELHHDKVEYAHIGDISLEKFNHAYGLDLTDEQFQEYVEQEGNLEPLCMLHHRGQEGVHSLDEPLWNVMRTSEDPQHVVMAQFNSEIGVQVVPVGVIAVKKLVAPQVDVPIERIRPFNPNAPRPPEPI